jgi:hypothetical protein
LLYIARHGTSVSSGDARSLRESTPGLGLASNQRREGRFPFADQKALVQNSRAFAERFCDFRLQS